MRLALCLLVACTPSPPTTHTTAISPADATLPTPAAPLPASFDAGVDFGASGAIVIKGYPTPFFDDGIMVEHISYGGFTSDGSELGYCDPGGPQYGGTNCTFQGKDGKVADSFAFGSSDPKDVGRKKGIAWLTDHGIPALKQPPPLVGSWAFAGDITLAVKTTGLDLLVGGSLAGEAAVFPIVVRPSHGLIDPATTEADLVALSPNGSELGVIARTMCGEWCNPKGMTRMPVTRFAARIYNDTAFVHHKRGEYAKAAELFAKASVANPDESLFVYNLACAYARLGDPRADAALARAIALGGEAVKKRATGDADFDTVRAMPWFQASVR